MVVLKNFQAKQRTLQLTTKGYLVQRIDRKGAEDIQQKDQMIDFCSLLLQFKSVEEIKAISNLCNI